jgi:TetR/AcrR family transcriptional regulator
LSVPALERGPIRKRLTAPERRKKIVAAAREVFITQGFSGARTKEIAERAGVTEAFLYRHFDSKDDMYESAVLEPLRTGLVELADDVQTLYDEYPDRVEFVYQLNRRCLTFYDEYAGMQTTALYSEIANGREFYLSALKPTLDCIGDLIADRLGWSDQGVDAKIVRQSMLGALWAIGLDFTLRGGGDIEEAAWRVTEIFTGGILEKSA